MALEVRPLTTAENSLWDAFVDAHPHRSPFHLVAWKKTLEASFRYRAEYLLAIDSGRLRGVLPLFLIDNPIMGRVLLSSPFAMYGGILADSPEVLAAIAAHATGMAKRLEVQYLELRNSFPEQCAGFHRISRYVSFTQHTNITSEEELLEALPKKTRNMVRKSLKYGYSTRFTEDLGAFYDLMTRNYRRLGTPIFPRAYFAELLRNFGPLADLREILMEGQVAAASINLLYGGDMHTFYAASNQKLLHAAPNNYMYFDYLLWAARNGFPRFDFGRSKLDTGTYEFKRHWLTEMRELPYEILLVKRKDLPNFSPKNPKFELALKVWERLPLAVTRWLGPYLIRLFP
jgi:FemAB-related protein (PEP-CTERM system-associated)